MMQTGRTVGSQVDRALELLVVWVLAVSALGLVAALAGCFLAPQVCLAAFLLTGLYAWCTRRANGLPSASPDWRHVALLMLVCLFFRLPAYHYVLGGQDEGIYVNVAHHIARTGAVAVEDTAMERLDDPGLVTTYLKENRGGSYLPGIYTPEPDSPKLTFQFYHLFPVWMAFFEGLFGAAAAVYALTFFSCLSVLFMYRLALAISGSRIAAMVAGTLLALNPLHAFFSKFPVTEVPALAFSLIGLTSLVRFRQEVGGAVVGRWLWISAASLGCLFATRISGFMYVPFIVAASMASAVCDQGAERRKGMFLWSVLVVSLYGVSVWYGLRWSHSYASDIYRLSFTHFFPRHWRGGVTTCVALGLAAWLATIVLARSSNRRERMQRCMAPLRKALSLVVCASLFAGLFKIYQLGWTSRFLHDPWIGQAWHLAGGKWESVRATSLFALLVYLGPLLPAGVLALVLRQKNPKTEFLRLVTAGFFSYVALLQWTIAYGPYYARYLLSEVAPFLILLTVLWWASLKIVGWKSVVGCLLGVSMFYMAFASAAQIGKDENKGVYETLARLLAPVDPGDLVLMTSLAPGWPAASQIKTPILYTFGRKVINVSDASLSDPNYVSALDGYFDDVFLLSTNLHAPAGFAPVDNARLSIWAFQRSFWYPSDFGLATEKRLYLYRLERSVVPLSHAQRFDSEGGWNQWLATGWNSPEIWGTWSKGKHAEIDIAPNELPRSTNGLRLHFEANVLVSPNHPRQRITIALDGTGVATYDVTWPASTVEMNVVVPADRLKSRKNLAIGLDLPDAVAPGDIGIGSDPRVLALGMKSVTAYPLGGMRPATESDKPSSNGN